MNKIKIITINLKFETKTSKKYVNLDQSAYKAS